MKLNPRHPLLKAALCAAFTLLLAGCGKKSDKRLVVFGDSISYGAFTSASYPKLLAQSFNMSLENHSVSSTALTSDAQIGTIRTVTLSASDTILYSPGINDALQHKSDPDYLALYEKDLTEILDQFEASGATAFVGEPLHVMNEGAPPDSISILTELRADSEYYASILKKILAERNYQHVHFVDSREQFQPLPQYMHDGVHPNDDGHQKLFEIFRPAMASILK